MCVCVCVCVRVRCELIRISGVNRRPKTQVYCMQERACSGAMHVCAPLYLHAELADNLKHVATPTISAQ